MSAAADILRDFSAPARRSAARWSRELGVTLPPELVLAIIYQESRGNPAAIGDAGELGLMQMKPATAAGLGVPTSALFVPALAIDAGSHYLAAQLKRYGGDVVRAVSAYNAGSAITGNLDSYVVPVLDAWREFFRGKVPPAASSGLVAVIVLAAAAAIAAATQRS